MTDIHKILTEWTYRLDSGYPKTDSDYEVLRDVLVEKTDLARPVINNIVKKSKGLTEQDDIDNESQDNEIDSSTIKSILIQKLKLPSAIVDQIITIYNKMSTDKQLLFNKNFRTHSIESFVETGYKAFTEFFLVNIGGARGGMGNGEMSILLGVKDSMPGGTAQHDIVMTNGEWEVKELKSGKFDPAKAGQASLFKLTPKIQEFYKDTVIPISKIGDPYDSLKDVVNPESADELKKLIMIMETRFESTIDPSMLDRFEWKKSAMHNWYEGFKELHNVFYKTNLDTMVKDTRLTVDKDGNKISYWISDEDVEELELAAGEDTSADVFVSAPIDNINQDIVIWFKRLERHEFVKNPQNFLFDLNSIKNNFFSGILGLIWYNHRNPQPNIGRPTDFAIDLVSQGRYRFVRKDISSSRGYEYIQEQE
jgi:hypothetical protein